MSIPRQREDQAEIKEDNPCAQNDTKSQESRENITRDDWVASIKDYNEGTTNKHRIGKVPSMIRGIESNKKCFDPLIVSIGPYHHNKPELQAFETLKRKYAKQFVHACGDQVSIEMLIAGVENVVANARDFYEEGSTKDYDNEPFTRMMFLDGCFVLQFMLNDITTQNMKIFDAHCVCRDLFLLENQIPSLILQVLMKFMPESKMTNAIQNFLNTLYEMPPQETSWLNLKLDDRPHLLDLIRGYLIGPCDKKGSSSSHSNPFRSVAEFRSAGIHFRASKTHHVTDVQFKSHRIFGGTLMLSPIVVDDDTKPLYLNLVAYEMSLNDEEDWKISSYLGLMDSLIDHADDVKELRKQGIILNVLGSDEQLAQLFNEIGGGVGINPYAYGDIMCEIEKQCKDKSQVWIAESMHKHFSSPWTVLALLGALLVIALTIVQTYLAFNSRG